LAVALLASTTSASAARRVLVVNAAPTDGAAPLQVTFAAPASVNWDFGDGTFGSGQNVVHTYAAGRWTATWTAGGVSGSIPITARGIELDAPARVRYGHRVTFRGRLIPAEGGAPVQISDGSTTLTTTSRADGSFAVKTRLAHGGTWTATSGVAT